MTIPRIRTQEGTTNEIDNPNAAVNTDGFVGQRSAVVSRVTTEGQAATCFRVVTPGTQIEEGIVALNNAVDVMPGQTWTYSVDLWGEGIVQLQVREGTSEGSFAADGKSAPITLGETRTRYTFTHTITAEAAVYAAPKVVTTTAPQAVTFFAVAHQFEQKDHATAFTIGTRPDRYLPGYMDLGSTHIGPLTPH